MLTARVHLACSQPEEALSCLAGLDDAPLTPAVLAAAAGLGAAARLALATSPDWLQDLGGLAALYREYGLALQTALLPAPDLKRLKAAAANAGMTLGVPAHFGGVIPGSRQLALLTPREDVVLRSLARTGSIAEIAAENFVSPNTVKSQLRSIYRKLQVSDREAALVQASLRGLL